MTTACKLGILIGAFTSLAAGQYLISVHAGTIHFVMGGVFLDDMPLQPRPLTFPSLMNQQVLRTERGRVEVLLAPGVFLRMAQQGALRMLDNRVESAVAEIQKGQALIEVIQLVKTGDVQIQCGDARTRLKAKGLYLFDADETNLRVFAGEAEVVTPENSVKAGKGKSVSLEHSAGISSFQRKTDDTLYKWSARRSFNLFMAGLASGTGKNDMNWVYTTLGYFWNPDYRTQFHARGSMFRYLPAEPDPRQ